MSLPAVHLKSIRFRFRRVVREHQRWFTFAGTFIVFITFISKEGLNERWRETADQMDKARAAYYLAVERDQDVDRHRELMIRLDDVQLSVIRGSRGKTSAAVSSVLSDPKYQLDQYRRECMDLFIGTESVLAMADPLIEKLPAKNLLHSQLSTLHDQFKEAFYESRALEVAEDDVRKKQELSPGVEDNSFAKAEIGPPTWTYYSVFFKNKEQPSARLERNTMLERYSSFVGSLQRLRNDIVKASSVALSDAESIRRRDETLATYAWWTSVILFSLGWGLGILGKLYGSKEAGWAGE